MTPHPPFPVSWTACPFCGAKAHQRCRPQGADPADFRRSYPMGTYHAGRKVAARLAEALR